jgi:hypothetical protein
VEQLPLLPAERAGHDRHYDYFRKCLESGYSGEIREISDEERDLFSGTLADEQSLLHQSSAAVSNDLWLKICEKSDDPLKEFEGKFKGELPPLHEYRIPFDHHLAKIDLTKAEPGLRKLIKAKAKKIKAQYEHALETGVLIIVSPFTQFEERCSSAI